MATNRKTHHVAVFPFPFGSHPRPLFNLLLKLANSIPNSQFSFFTIPNSNQSLISPSNLDNLPHNIRFFDVESGVPSGYKFSGNPVEPLDLFLISAPQNVTRAFETAVADTGIKITCIVTDAFLNFSGEIAESFGVSWIAVWQALPSTLSAHFYTPIIREKCATGSDEKLDFLPGLSTLRVKDLPAEVISQIPARESVFSRTLSQIGEKLPKATAVAVTCYEQLVPETLHNDLKSKFKNYLNLGFLSMSLPPAPLSESSADQTGCLSWLDSQPSKSVLYISFGTVVSLQEKELKAVAEALESSKIPFLWSMKDNSIQNLPDGFIESTGKQGKVVPWAPQSSVLAHGSVAVFVTHGGYNSVSESIVHGVPMICRPFFADQMMMARIVEVEWGIGVTVEDGVISKNGFLKDLEVFFPSCSERGKKMRENVEELKKVVSMASMDNASAARDFSRLIEIISKF